MQLLEHAYRLSSMSIGEGPYKGEALDIDNNPDTCAPHPDCTSCTLPSDCAWGLHNSMWFVYDSDWVWKRPTQVWNSQLESLCVDEMITILISADIDFSGENPFTLYVFGALLEPGNSNCASDVQAETWITPSSFSPSTCFPTCALDNARYEDGVIKAGGPGYQIPMLLPFVGTGHIPILTARNAQLLISCPNDTPDNTLSSCTGLVGGAFSKNDILAFCNALPDDYEVSIWDKFSFCMLFDLALFPDIDTDGDNTWDSISFAYKFKLQSAKVLGVGESSL